MSKQPHRRRSHGGKAVLEYGRKAVLGNGRKAVLAAVALLAVAGKASAMVPEAPLGNWLTEDRHAVISITPCGKAICGQIAGIPLAIPGEPIPTDNKHRSQCHLTILWDGMPANAEWKARIMDPRNGREYGVILALDKQRRLLVHGYLGIPLLGRTQVWTPFTAPVPADCRLPPRDPQAPTLTPTLQHGPAASSIDPILAHRPA